MQTHLKDNTRLFQQVRSHIGSDDLERGVEIDLDVLPESGGVVVSGRFRISDGLHDWGWGEDSFLDLSLCLRCSADGCKVSHGVFGADSFAGSGFTGYDDGLISIVPKI